MPRLQFKTRNTSYEITKYESGEGRSFFLYLHGGPGFCCGPEQEWIAPILSKHFNCVWFDQLGCHTTPAASPEQLNWENCLDDIQGIIKTHAPPRVHLVAHSFGAHLAHALVEICPDRIADVVFISPSHDIPSRMKRTLRLGAERASTPMVEDALRLLAELLETPPEKFGLQETEKFGSVFLRTPDIWALYWENRQAMDRYLQMGEAHPVQIDAFMRLHTAAYHRTFDSSIYTSHEVLILQGAQDVITTLEQDAKPLAHRIGHAKIHEIQGAAHWPQFEQTEQVISEMLRFLDK